MSLRLWVLCVAAALAVGAVTWLSGPPEFDYLDGTEFAICGARLDIAHPPGYPLFISILRTASTVLPCSRLDYNCLRLVTSAVSSLGLIAAVAAMMSFGIGAAPALLGSIFFFTLGGVMAQLNVLEVHGFALLLSLLAIRTRHSRAGPYMLSLSMFGGHPVSLLLLPAIWTERFRQRWVLLGAIPASIWLFVPIRAMGDALCHYSHPTTLGIFSNYLTLYGGKFSWVSSRAVDAIFHEIGPASLALLLIFIAVSGKVRWRLLAAFGTGFLYLTFYMMADTNSLIWIPLLPLGIWAAEGIARLFERGGWMRPAVVLLVLLSAFSGVVRSWRADDHSASVLSRDVVRGVGLEGVYISIGFVTFHSAYLFEVLDMRPDIIPMDTYQCYYRIPPPLEIPGELAGRTVFSTRGWDQDAMILNGLIFRAEPDSIDWDIFDVFRFDGNVYDGYARDDIAEAWVRRAVQTSDPSARELYSIRAMRWSATEGTLSRIGLLMGMGMYEQSIKD